VDELLDHGARKLLKLQFLVILGALFLGILTVSLVTAIGDGIASIASPHNYTGSNSVAQTTGDSSIGFIAVGAGLAIGLAGLGAGIGLGSAGAAAIAAITEKPETFGRAIIFIAFIEGVAIFGFVIAFLLSISLQA